MYFEHRRLGSLVEEVAVMAISEIVEELSLVEQAIEEKLKDMPKKAALMREALGEIEKTVLKAKRSPWSY